MKNLNIEILSPKKTIKFAYGLTTAILWFLLNAVFAIIFVAFIVMLGLNVDWYYGSDVTFMIFTTVSLVASLLIATYITSRKLRKNVLFKVTDKKLIATNTISFAASLFFLFVIIKMYALLDVVFSILFVGGYYLLCNFFTSRKI